jgi:hypothetical protein
MYILGGIGPTEILLVFTTLLIPLSIGLVIIWLINSWVNKNVNVKKEQNELLKELIKVLDKKG